ncbi:MAG: hypothetical protein IJF36_00940 [Oscillibacter sp.]|nr:hypothetical protein [Oscillibacter sp.]
MENYPIKSVTFGGFDKQDVIRYIEQTALDHDAARKELETEIEGLNARIEELNKANAALQEEIDGLHADKDTLISDRNAERAAAEETISSLKAEAERLRPDAENYARFRDRLGAIECEARERAGALERSTSEHLQKTVEDFRSQYSNLMSIVENTTTYMTGELRKVEVTLSQLPRAMDRPGAELNELAKKLSAE